MKINIEVRILNELHFIYFKFLIDLYIACQRNEKNTGHMFNVTATEIDFLKACQVLFTMYSKEITFRNIHALKTYC